ncbi:PREDICTED: uncharacterized protein LOC104747490 [Camelina sativa]|uniref:Uncharacterized protein LOC104747490 n=1 Tax=Camelina sativa TaxID=90675 RepID=A0ABM0W902_CAMSA|nr:PREDICTED: uncharacterized protein LOC104747490 [Camelina sativa]
MASGSGSSKTEAETVQLASTVAETVETTTGESSGASSMSKDISDSDDNESSAADSDGDSTSEDLPVWLVDGFGEYTSPDSDSYTDEEEERKARLYRRNLSFSDGFLVEEGTGPPANRWCGGIGAIKLKSLDDEHSPVEGRTQLQYAQDMARLSLRKYNALNETDVKLDHVVRMTGSSPGSWTASYISFMAKESDEDDTLVEYQAKVAKKKSERKTYPIFCRPSPKLDPDM